MFLMRAQEVSLPAVAETRLGVARLADRVCEATRQAALEGAGSALSILAANQSPVLPDAIRDLANRALARTAIMQTEFDRFRAVTRRGVSELTARQEEEPARKAASFVDLAKHRTRCHGDMRRPVRHAKRRCIVWEMNSYRDFLSENSGRHNVVGSGLVIAVVAALLLVLFA